MGAITNKVALPLTLTLSRQGRGNNVAMTLSRQGRGNNVAMALSRQGSGNNDAPTKSFGESVD
ncbi:MAG TPA: hypothetical protein PKK79_00900 [Syntrophorhabdaceae bacterium]|nr:hypothetical protein [Syntrophorhabdaceae bacterium]